MKLPLFIAWRYLFSRKAHNVINVISVISVVGMAVGTAALILILSIYNGFGGIIRSNISDACPDVKILPSKGKSFVPSASMISSVTSTAGVRSVSSVIEENVFLNYSDRQAVARAKGVDSLYLANSTLSKHLTEGIPVLQHGELPMCCLGSGLAGQLGAYPRFSDPITIYFPIRGESISMSDPMSSLNKATVYPSAVISLDAESDRTFLLLPIDLMRQLTGYTREVSALEIQCAPGTAESAASELSSKLGPEYQVQDIYRQNADLYRMMRYEKMAVFSILIFVILIIAFNVFSSLSLLIIEKSEDVFTLRALGADDRSIRRIFVLEGWLISLVGMIAGLAVGLLLAYLQQRYGIIKMPGNYLIDAYPVIIDPSDILLTVAGVTVIGYLMAVIPRPRTSDPRREA